MSENTKELGLRIKQIRNHFFLNQEAFGYTLNLTRSAICTYENGIRTPRTSTLKLIIDKYNVNPDFLFNGQQPMFLSELEALDMLNLLNTAYDLTSIDRDLIYNYLILDDNNKTAIRKYILSLENS